MRSMREALLRGILTAAVLTVLMPALHPAAKESTAVQSTTQSAEESTTQSTQENTGESTTADETEDATTMDSETKALMEHFVVIDAEGRAVEDAVPFAATDSTKEETAGSGSASSHDVNDAGTSSDETADTAQSAEETTDAASEETSAAAEETTASAEETSADTEDTAQDASSEESTAVEETAPEKQGVPVLTTVLAALVGAGAAVGAMLFLNARNNKKRFAAPEEETETPGSRAQGTAKGPSGMRKSAKMKQAEAAEVPKGRREKPAKENRKKKGGEGGKKLLRPGFLRRDKDKKSA